MLAQWAIKDAEKQNAVSSSIIRLRKLKENSCQNTGCSRRNSKKWDALVAFKVPNRVTSTGSTIYRKICHENVKLKAASLFYASENRILRNY